MNRTSNFSTFNSPARQLPLPMRLLQQYGGQVLRATLTDTTVAEAFTHVQQMLAQPTLFFRPDIMRCAACWRRRNIARARRRCRPGWRLCRGWTWPSGVWSIWRGATSGCWRNQ